MSASASAIRAGAGPGIAPVGPSMTSSAGSIGGKSLLSITGVGVSQFHCAGIHRVGAGMNGV